MLCRKEVMPPRLLSVAAVRVEFENAGVKFLYHLPMDCSVFVLVIAK